MSSLTRRMQRMQPHKSLVLDRQKNAFRKVATTGRKTGLVHFGDKLGLKNPRAKKPFSLGARGSRRTLKNTWRSAEHRDPA